METTPNRYITVAYKLYVKSDDGEKEMMEEATVAQPFQFISGMGTTLDAFENQIQDLKPGDKFDFTIPCAEAYGDYEDEHVLDLPRNIFEVDGHFDAERIYEGNVVPLVNADGQRLNGTVVEVKEDIVVMDLNHPLAGDDLNFVGEVVENREATKEEIQGMLNMMTGGGCSCGCDSCGDDCGCGSDDSCGCGSCH